MYYFALFCSMFSCLRFLHSLSDIYFDGKTYIKYFPSKAFFEKDCINRIEFSFRTMHPSGMLTLMIGRYDDTLGLQLIQGKLRYVVS